MNRFEYDDASGNVVDHEPKHHYPGGNCSCCGWPLPTTFEEERDQLRDANASIGKIFAVVGGLGVLITVAATLWESL